MRKKRSLKKLYKILREVRSHREQMAAARRLKALMGT